MVLFVRVELVSIFGKNRKVNRWIRILLSPWANRRVFNEISSQAEGDLSLRVDQ